MPEIIIRDSQPVLIDRSLTVILDCEKINIEYDLKDGEYAILIFNDHHGNVTLNESGKISHSHIQISYLQLEKYDLKQYSRIDVMKDSQLEVHTTYLGTAKKDVVFDLFNRESDSSVNISNNINGLYRYDRQRGKTFEMSPVFTLSDDRRSEKGESAAGAQYR